MKRVVDIHEYGIGENWVHKPLLPPYSLNKLVKPNFESVE